MVLTNPSTSEMSNLWSFVLFCALSQHSKASGARQRCQDAFTALGAEREQSPAGRKAVHSTSPLSAPCKEITSDSVWDNSLSARRDFWWSLEVAKTHSTVMVRRRGGGKKSSLGKKLQRVKFLTLHWALHLLLGFFCHTRSLLQCHCGHSHTILSSCSFLYIQNCSQNPQSPFCDQSGTYFTMVALLMAVRHGNLNSQKSKKALQKSCINSPSHVFSSHALSTPHFHGVSSALISREGVSQQT